MRKSIHSIQHAVLRQELIAARRSRGLTQQALADSLDEHQSFVAKYENGDRRLDVIEFLEIATALGVKPSRILDKIATAAQKSKA